MPRAQPAGFLFLQLSELNLRHGPPACPAKLSPKPTASATFRIKVTLPFECRGTSVAQNPKKYKLKLSELTTLNLKEPQKLKS